LRTNLAGINVIGTDDRARDRVAIGHKYHPGCPKDRDAAIIADARAGDTEIITAALSDDARPEPRHYLSQRIERANEPTRSPGVFP